MFRPLTASMSDFRPSLSQNLQSKNPVTMPRSRQSLLLPTVVRNVPSIMRDLACSQVALRAAGMHRSWKTVHVSV